MKLSRKVTWRRRSSFIRSAYSSMLIIRATTRSFMRTALLVYDFLCRTEAYKGFCEIAYMKLTKYTEALADVDKSIELNSEYTKAYYRRGEIREAMGEFEEAVRDFKKVHQLDPRILQ